MIIGLFGPKYSGRTKLADCLKDEGFEKISFEKGMPVKEIQSYLSTQKNQVIDSLYSLDQLSELKDYNIFAVGIDADVRRRFNWYKKDVAKEIMTCKYTWDTFQDDKSDHEVSELVKKLDNRLTDPSLVDFKNFAKDLSKKFQ